MTITEKCGCGASINVTGTERSFGVGYQVARWRKEHGCRLRAPILMPGSGPRSERMASDLLMHALEPHKADLSHEQNEGDQT
jgi:hypothetical protein